MLWFDDRDRGVLVVCVICHHDVVNRRMDWIEATLRGTVANQHKPDENIIIDADTDTPLKVELACDADLKLVCHRSSRSDRAATRYCSWI